MTRGQNKEHGQILVLVVVGLVGLLGFTSLAIDGGMILSDRRYDQAAADAASLAGAGAVAESFQIARVNNLNFSCADAKVVTAMNQAAPAAIASASTNTFTIDNDPSDGNGVSVTCSATRQTITVKVMITKPVKTSFAHLFYKGEIKNTVESVVEVEPLKDIGYGNTIVALRKTCEGSNKVGVTFNGSSEVTIDKGGVWSNSCGNANGTDLEVHVNGAITYHDSYTFKESGDPDVSATGGVNPSGDYIEKTKLDPPDCSDPSLGNFGSVTASGLTEIEPGNYTGITVNHKDDVLMMAPGLYCLTGDFKVAGGSIIGNGVTIYMKKNGNHDTDFSVGGNAGSPTPSPDLGTIQLTAPLQTCKSWICPPAIKGLLVYLHMDPNNPANSNQGNVTFQGNESSVFSGTIYAPDGSVDLGGTSNTTTSMGVQVIADTVKIHGTVELDVYTTEDNILLMPASLSQTR